VLGMAGLDVYLIEEGTDGGLRCLVLGPRRSGVFRTARFRLPRCPSECTRKVRSTKDNVWGSGSGVISTTTAQPYQAEGKVQKAEKSRSGMKLSFGLSRAAVQQEFPNAW